MKHGDDESTFSVRVPVTLDTLPKYLFSIVWRASGDLSPVLPAKADGVRKIISRLAR